MKVLAIFLFSGALLEVLGTQSPATRWGIISAGKISHDFIKGMALHPESEHKVVAIAARDLDRAQAYANTFNISRAYGSYAELANDAEIDVVYVGTINPFHLPVVKMFLEAGIPVLCEKPLALNTAEVEEMVALSESKNVFLMEGMYSRFIPAFEFIMEQIASGVIGEVVHVDTRFFANLLGVPRVVEKELGGGANLDIGVYNINVILEAFGDLDPVNITAVGVLNDDGCDIATSATLEFPGGKIGTYVVDARATAPDAVVFLGTEGFISIPSVGVPEIITVNDEVYEFSEQGEGYNWDTAQALRHQAVEVRRCLLGGEIESPRMSHQHSLRSARIVETLFKIISDTTDPTTTTTTTTTSDTTDPTTTTTTTTTAGSSCKVYFSTRILLFIIVCTLTSNVL